MSPTVHEESPVTVKKETSLRALSTETKLLYRELLDYSASPKLVDLQSLDAGAKKGWVPQRKTAAHQLWERKREGEKLSRRVKGLMEKVDKCADDRSSIIVLPVISCILFCMFISYIIDCFCLPRNSNYYVVFIRLPDHLCPLVNT
jgi:hypothetical protein